jgi:hypothetical protein
VKDEVEYESLESLKKARPEVGFDGIGGVRGFSSDPVEPFKTFRRRGGANEGGHVSEYVALYCRRDEFFYILFGEPIVAREARIPATSF